MPDVRECLSLQRDGINALTHELGCHTPVGAVLFEDDVGQAVIIGRQGDAAIPATLQLRAAGRWVEVLETWTYDQAIFRLQAASYRYAVFESEPDAGSDPMYRWELHPFTGGRSRAIYGHASFPHLHVGGQRDHVPTGLVNVETFLRYVIAEGTDVGEAEAGQFVHSTKDAEHAAREWRSAS